MSDRNFFEKRFELVNREKHNWTQDNQRKLNLVCDENRGESEKTKILADELKCEYQKSCYSRCDYHHVDTLCAGLAKHTHKIEERFTQILVWILSQTHADFSEFNQWFLARVGQKKPLKYWYAEYTVGKKKEIDIIGATTETPQSGNDAPVVIECKIEAGFTENQLENYAKWLKSGKIYVILKYHCSLEAERQKIKDLPVSIEEPIYWYEIFQKLDKVKNSILREDLKSIFQRFCLNRRVFTKPFDKEKRTNIIEKIRQMIINAKSDLAIKENWTSPTQKGYCNFIIYSPKHYSKITGTGGCEKYALPSLSIGLAGYYIQGTGTKTDTEGYLLEVSANIFSDMKDVKDEEGNITREFICAWKNEKMIQYPSNNNDLLKKIPWANIKKCIIDSIKKFEIIEKKTDRDTNVGS